MTFEPMTPIEIKGHLGKFFMCLPILMTIPTDELLRLYSYNDTMGPFLDPTAWRDNHGNTSQNERLVRALAAFQKAAIEACGPDFWISADV